MATDSVRTQTKSSREHEKSDTPQQGLAKTSDSSEPRFQAKYSYVLSAIIAIATIFGIGNAISKTWLSDDAFISFRYAKNLSDGLGLVYNIGERVEGYTNFLWTTLLAGGLQLGIPPETLAPALGIASFAVLIGLLYWHSLRRKKYSKTLFLPFAALAVLLNRDMQVFATSGLETAFFTTLIFGAYSAIVRRDKSMGLGVAGILLSLAALTRPDGLLIYASAAAYIFATSRHSRGFSFRPMLKLIIPGLLIYGPYILLRWQYYGHWLPNTYYAKSAFLPYYSQGLLYLWLFVKTYYLFLVVPLLLLGTLLYVFKLRKQPLATKSQQSYDSMFLAFAMALPYCLAVVRVGGDFMFARLFVPIVPLLYVAIEESLERFSVPQKVRVALAGLALMSVIYRNDQYSDSELNIHDIADESRLYTSEFVAWQKHIGLAASEILRDSDAIVAFRGANAMLVYYANPEVAIEAECGLTDSSIAHQTLAVRGRPGHEKTASVEYLRERRVHLQFEVGLDFTKTRDELHFLQIGDLVIYLIGYDNRVMDKLKEHPGVRFVDFPKYLDDYIARMPALPPSKLQADYEEFKSFYFNYNKDDARETEFLALLGTYTTTNGSTSSSSYSP